MGIKAKHNGREVDLLATDDGDLIVRAVNETFIKSQSVKGKAFCWSSLDTDIDAGDTRIILRNTSDQFLVLEYALVNPGNVDCLWHVGIGQSTVALAGGTVITAVNLNEIFSTTTFDYDAMDDDTAIADATLMFPFRTTDAASSGFLRLPLDGIILGKNMFIQINQETESTSGQISIFGVYESELVT
jgi:hypothetical protein